jgi:phosphopantetheinyl transferase (holo-ACP synthase)
VSAIGVGVDLVEVARTRKMLDEKGVHVYDRAADGRPDVALTGLAAARARELGVTRVLLSLSHTHEAAVAVAVLSTD